MINVSFCYYFGTEIVICLDCDMTGAKLKLYTMLFAQEQ